MQHHFGTIDDFHDSFLSIYTNTYSIPGTNTYLIGRGAERLLIDTGGGQPSWQAALGSVLATEGATVKQALLTHWHHDHTNGVPDLLKICPGVKIYKNQPEGDMLDIADGQVFAVEGVTMRAFHTPGHTTDHMVFLLEEENAMFTGDSEFCPYFLSLSIGIRSSNLFPPWTPRFSSVPMYCYSLLLFALVKRSVLITGLWASDVLGHGTAVFEDLATYLATLKKMHDRAVGRAYPGHGDIIKDSKAKIMEYIQHRQQRENEVLCVLKFGTLDVERKESSLGSKAGSWTPLELVKIIYRDVPEDLHLPASHGVIQVLLKLENEGKVVHNTRSGRWAIGLERPAL